ncbi:host specificity protein J [Acidiphilium multivorum]|uniref:host specificity protein J n=1 Tax=Acidiphilium multivorum TaxID=62140 RepID=UPI001F4C490B|nr:phage tail protein [Acidiphilium multivorum]UNC12854.1 host specificity protein J [Acidiphilium multivorum]
MNALLPIRGSGGGGKGGGKGGGGGVNIQKDTLASRAYAQVMDLICEGEIEGLVGGMQGVYLDGTALQNSDGSMNYSGVSFAFVPGSQAQDWIPGFGEVDNTIAVQTEVKQTLSVTRTITTTNVDAVRVIVLIPQLSYTNTKNGDVSGTSVNIAIDVNTNGGGWVQRVNDTISGKASANYQRSYVISLPGGGPWEIRLRRITPDHDTTGYIADQVYWDSYTEIVYAKLTYPNSAIAALRVDAANFSRIPQRLYRCKLLRVQVPSNYDPATRAYSGAWDGTFQIAWTDNPAWCFYDLLTNDRYGLGQFVVASQIDKWSLYQIAQYCDELVPDGFGGTEPRFTCNCWINTRQAAFKVIQDFASVFRGMPFWSTGTVTAVQDAPSDPVALFNNANVIDGDFTYTGSSLKARHTIAMVTWQNMNDLGAKYVEYVGNDALIQKYGAIVAQVTAFGCTSRGQAHRVGQWLLYSEQYETETVSFKVGLDAAMVRPGDVIKVADTVRAGQRMGGRISAATTATITLDHALVDNNGAAIHPTGGTLSVISLDGTIESGTVQAIDTSVTNAPVISLTAALGSAPQAHALWILEIPAIAAQLFRVIQITESQPGEFTITALAHNPSKYAAIEDGAALVEQAITDLTIPPPPPSDVIVQESLYSFQSTIFSMAEISWPDVSGGIGYQVAWQKDSGNWNYANTPSNSFTIGKADPGSYVVRVWTFGPQQKLSMSYTEVTVRLLGKQAPPADVLGLTYGFDPNNGLILSWARNPDVDIAAYEIRRGGSWDTATVAGQINATTFVAGTNDLVDAADWLVKALSTSGVYSADAAQVSVQIPPASALDVGGRFAGENAVLSWNAVIGPLVIDHYEVSDGTGAVIGTVKGTTFTLKVNWAGAQSFTVVAVDIGGNRVSQGSVSLTAVLPQVTGATVSVIDNNVLLKWTAAAGTLPIDHYVLSQDGKAIGNINGLFATVFETQGGVYAYAIAPVDAAGNVGLAYTITATVAQPPDYVLHYNLNSSFGGTKAAIATDIDGSLVAPVDTTTTFEAHFTSQGWSSPQDQVNAGDALFIEPSPGSATYTEAIDYGTTLKASQILVTLTAKAIAGAPGLTVTIETSPDNSTWTSYPDTSLVYATAFRYVRVLLTVTGGAGDLLRITALNVKLEVKQISDSGTAICSAGDANGTPVTFNKSFIDVTSIAVTPQGTTPIQAVYDFQDVPNPTGFSIYLFDNAGNRVSGTAGWTANGV